MSTSTSPKRKPFVRLRKMATRVEAYLSKGHISSAAITSIAAHQMACDFFGKARVEPIWPTHQECIDAGRAARLRQRQGANA